VAEIQYAALLLVAVAAVVVAGFVAGSGIQSVETSFEVELPILWPEAVELAHQTDIQSAGFETSLVVVVHPRFVVGFGLY